jgi:hypothetical protein
MYYAEAQQIKKDRAAFIKRRQNERQKHWEHVEETRQVNPFTELRIVGRKVKILRAAPHTDVTLLAQQSLVPCPAELPTLIDRFDGRALIDMIPKGGWEGGGEEGDWGERSQCWASRAPPPPTPRDKAEASLLAYEAYKDMLKLARAGLSEEQAIHLSGLKFDARIEWEAEEEEKKREKNNLPGVPPSVFSYQGIYIESETEEEEGSDEEAAGEDDASAASKPGSAAGVGGVVGGGMRLKDILKTKKKLSDEAVAAKVWRSEWLRKQLQLYVLY